MSVSVGEREQAVEAWEFTDFPMLSPDDTTELVKVTSRKLCGQEGYLPSALFLPTRYELDDFSRASNGIRDTWRDNPHVAAVMERHLGPHASRMSTHIFEEMARLSSGDHKASVGYTAGRIMVDAESAHATYVSLWDNGKEYESSGEIMDAFTLDGWHDLLADGPVEGSARGGSWPTLILRNTVKVFNGTLTVASGANSVEMRGENEDYTFIPRKIPPILGNLVTVKLPHVSD